MKFLDRIPSAFSTYNALAGTFAVVAIGVSAVDAYAAYNANNAAAADQTTMKLLSERGDTAAMPTLSVKTQLEETERSDEITNSISELTVAILMATVLAYRLRDGSDEE